MIDLKTRAVAPFFPDARTFHNIYKLQKNVLLRHQSYLIVFMGNKNLLFWQIMPLLMSVHAYMQSMYFYVQYCGIEIDHISLGYPVSHVISLIFELKLFMKFKFSFIQRIIFYVNVVVTIITFYCVDKCKFIIWYKFNFGVRDLFLFIYTFWNALLYWNNSQTSYSCLKHDIK